MIPGAFFLYFHHSAIIELDNTSDHGLAVKGRTMCTDDSGLLYDGRDNGGSVENFYCQSRRHSIIEGHDPAFGQCLDVVHGRYGA